MDLSDALAAAVAEKNGQAREAREPKILPSAQVEELRHVYAAFTAVNQFKPGDFVTVKLGYGGYKHAGRPMIVLEVLDEPIREGGHTVDVSPAAHTWRAAFNVRCAIIIHDERVAFWYEHWALESYDPSKHKEQEK